MQVNADSGVLTRADAGPLPAQDRRTRIPLEGAPERVGAGCLHVDVGIANIDVMESDIPSGALPPPLPNRPTRELGAQELCAMARTELQNHLASLLRVGAPNCSLDEPAGDGSPRIPSLVSVWLISQVGQIVGTPRLVKLSAVQSEDLRSLAGVARLTRGALDSLAATASTP